MVASLASIGSAHRLGEGSVLEDLSVIDAGIDDALLLRAEVLIEWVEEHEVPAEPDWCGSALGEPHAGPSFTSPEHGVDEWGPRRLGRDLDGVLPERPVPIAGDGAPMVSDFALVDLAATLRRSVASATRLVGGVCELAYRLPKIWARTRGGSAALWRSLRVAEKTQTLPWEAARQVDEELVSVLGSCSWAQVDRCVQAALARYEEAMRRNDASNDADADTDADADADDPEEAPGDAGATMTDDARRLRIYLQEAGTDPAMRGAGGIGLTAIEGTIDDADALDLETAIRELASGLAEAGSTDPLDVRRAKAVGLLARGEVPLPNRASDDSGDAARTGGSAGEGSRSPGTVATAPAETGAPPGSRRRVRLVLHLTDTALFGEDGVGRCENTLAPASIEQIKRWCAGSRVQVQPVLDVAGHRPVGSYEIPDHLRAQVHYRDVECAFPHCHAPARSCDLDHVVPYPEGPTCACNLVPLCRRHHRAKTARRWSYVMVHPGCYYWHSPAGGHYLVDSHGTHALPDLSDVGAAARFRRPCVADISARIHAPEQPALPRDGRPRAPTHRARPETTSPAESATRGPTMSGPHSPPPLPEEPPPF